MRLKNEGVKYIIPILCLCNGCHEQWHAFKNSLDQYFAYLNPENLEQARDVVYRILREQMAEERAARESAA